jgi:hypothetical protein
MVLVGVTRYVRAATTGGGSAREERDRRRGTMTDAPSGRYYDPYDYDVDVHAQEI